MAQSLKRETGAGDSVAYGLSFLNTALFVCGVIQKRQNVELLLNCIALWKWLCTFYMPVCLCSPEFKVCKQAL